MFLRSLLTIPIVFLVLSGAVVAQQYQPGKGAAATFEPGLWDGRFQFSNVYCVRFPSPNTAFSFSEKLFNRDAIHLARAEYLDKLMANIVVSTIPRGRTTDEEVARLVEGERAAERTYSHSYNNLEFATQFGPTVGLRIKDVAPAGRDAPFPLVRPIYRPAKKPIESLSVHRLFVRGPDRFEVAVYQTAPQDAGDRTEAEMTERLTKLADNIVESLQSCTGKMPIRSTQ